MSKSKFPDATETPAAETYLTPAPHELGANLIFTEHELQPYFGLDRVTKDAGGSTSTWFRSGGERYEVKLYYQDETGLKPPDRDDFRLDEVREFRIRVQARDGTGERKASFHIAPRWPDMKSKGDAPNPSTPNITGLNVRVDGSNIALESYPALLRQSVSALGVNARYFRSIHSYSNIFAFERYVRVDRDRARKVVGSNSPLQRIFEHVAGDAKFRELREDDRDLEGYHHRVKLDSAGAAQLVEGHSLGKKIKHYHPKHVRDDPEDPLFHPKVGVSLQKNANADGAVSWSDREGLVRELDETLLNLLSWAGLPVRADSSVYVEDAYFSVRETVRELSLIEDPTPEIRREQESLVEVALAQSNPNSADAETLQVVADGGRTPEEIAAEVGCSKRTIYRVVKRLSNILSRRNGAVGFASDYLADAVQRALGDVADALDKDGDSSGDGSAFDAWRHRYGVECEDPRSARLQLRIGRVDEDVKTILREGYRAWVQSGREGRRFDTARFSYRKDGYHQVQQGRR